MPDVMQKVRTIMNIFDHRNQVQVIINLPQTVTARQESVKK